MDPFLWEKPVYEGREFIGLSCPGEMISGKVFQDCYFEGCNFSESQFLSCEFQDCRFNHCELSLIRVKGSQFKGVRFEDSKAIGINWAEASWPQLDGLESIDFTGCVLNYASFFGLRMKKRKLVGCAAVEVDFAEADFTDADCTGTDFQKSRFLHTNLTRADFTGARNYSISPLLNQIKQAKFSLPEAMSLLYNLEITLVE